MRASLLALALTLLTPALASDSSSSSSTSTSTSTAPDSEASENAVPLNIPYWPDPPANVIVETISKPDDCPMVSQQGDRIYTMYNGTYTHPRTGKVITFDTTYDEEMRPFIFFLKAGQVTKGFDIGFDGMCVGEKRRIVVPPKFAYGKQGRVPHIPGWATLVFEAQLMHIERIDWAEQARKAREQEEAEAKEWGKTETIEDAEVEKKKAEHEKKQAEEAKQRAEEAKAEQERMDRNEIIEELGDIKDEL